MDTANKTRAVFARHKQLRQLSLRIVEIYRLHHVYVISPGPFFIYDDGEPCHELNGLGFIPAEHSGPLKSPARYLWEELRAIDGGLRRRVYTKQECRIFTRKAQLLLATLDHDNYEIDEYISSGKRDLRVLN